MGQEMPFLEHLTDLRRRLLIVAVALVLSVLICFLFVDHIYQLLASRSGEKLAILGPGDILSIYVKLSAVGGIAFTIPIAAYQAWKFVVPALQERERKIALMYIPALFLLFLLGLSFAYLILFPMMYHFVLGLSNGNFDLVITANDYFTFMLNLCLPFGLLFELPVVVLFLSHLGILNPHRLAKMRKPAYLVLSVISITITPPDFLSDIMVIVPLIVLYEISISISRVIHRKRTRETALSA
ncbi:MULTISPECIES: twin-arginine translocase subunit TatC [Brevibacillus]|jgi:sec-independent protein translocase protein TatC|uniref:Sec-independent protein translocase protein TatC n=1 Tax=Brevibacillus nitrificans TaxID=651560 RepID=A0A3M8CPX6_9BACL|nr:MULTISPECIES: twin-arginine translocase subunit TatC [Brevibacillus]MEC2133094.1 twin-arginine translocase subunit TatC [Brevibacillus centrosporus]MED1954108.1 twin-arginine translocase subunit TatC [Brevibacillus centrosporus]RNB62823.1 twin-arginine translocase subunit TatC [Brevibacillus centrosporus]RNB77822.1 twin-arginine translocase subunit TatC [Brevibacillus nitrificans]GED33816.1 Sec-independent protein translocase protein TatCd [Brevibacillus centrosporus]